MENAAGCKKCIFPRNCATYGTGSCLIRGMKDFRKASETCGKDCTSFRCKTESACLSADREVSDEHSKDR